MEEGLFERTFFGGRGKELVKIWLAIEKLPEKKTGRPLMLGETLNKEVQVYIQETRKVGGVSANRAVGFEFFSHGSRAARVKAF